MVARLWAWFDARMPSVAEQWKIHASEYYAPKNFNFWYFFGSLAMLVLVIQIVSGIFLTMNYKPDAGLAFGSVEYIMRDVPFGWLLRYIHSTGAPAARARSEGHMLATKGTAAPTPATPPATEVATTRLRRVLSTFVCSLMEMDLLWVDAKPADFNDGTRKCPRFRT